ncbi:MAG: phosphatase PAP2 family protein [Planctomycetota bacterium]
MVLRRSSVANVLMLCVPVACTTNPDDSHLRRHFDGRVWSGAVVAQTESAEKLVPALVLLGTTVAVLPRDRELQRESREGALTEGSTKKGDGAAIGLGVLGTGFALGQLAGGDRAGSLEVLFESFLVVDGVTEILKHGVQRDRPGDGSSDSFPSGHTSFAFTMATYIARSVDDLGDAWYTKLGYLAYVPAAYVGIDRSEANRHYPSDVAFGAFLGLVLTNIVYDAHYGAPGHRGLYGTEGVRGWSLEPSVSGERTAVELVYRF